MFISIFLLLLDCVLSVCIVHTAVVIVAVTIVGGVLAIHAMHDVWLLSEKSVCACMLLAVYRQPESFSYYHLLLHTVCLC